MSGQTLTDRLGDLLQTYYREEVGELAQHYPNEQKSLYVSWTDVYRSDATIADDWLETPGEMKEYAEEALRLFDLPADVRLSDAHVRLTDLPDDRVFYPGEYSPTEMSGDYIAVEGQISQRTAEYATMKEAAFECQRCATPTFIPQSSKADANGFQEPHECQGCERQGPFQVDFSQSEYVDGQKFRIEEPPEISKGGDPAYIDVFVEDDLVGQIESGDRARVAGTMHLEQATNGNKKANRFTPYMDGQAIIISETEFEDIEISDEEEEQILSLAHGERDIFEAAKASIAPGITGEEYEHIKLGIFLQLISGVRTELPGGTYERGNVHQLMIGDPGAGKSSLMKAAEQIAPRSVSVSGHGATKAGITAAAVRNDFVDNGEWTLDPGALVQAHKGLACVDELDKVPEEVAKSMHEAMSDERIPINKAGINATLPAQTAVLAAANPKHGRWDDREEDHSQVEIGSTLMSRFALIWKVEDKPDEKRDREISQHQTLRKDVAKRHHRPDVVSDGGEVEGTSPEISHDLLRKYIAYARREVADPVYENEEVREKVSSSYVSLRGANGYDPNAAVPISPRKIDDIVRLAEAAARAELRETITMRHVKIAQSLVGESLRQFGQNEEGDFDADIVETGSSKTQEDRKRAIVQYVEDNQGDKGGVGIGKIASDLAKDGYNESLVKDEITNEEGLLRRGELYEPSEGAVRRWT